MLIYLANLETQEEKDEFIALYDTYRKRMWHIAAGILKDEYLAEDIVHDAFLKMSKNFNAFIGKSRNENGKLIVTIMRRLSYNLLKRGKILEFIPIEEDIRYDDLDNSPENVTINEDQYKRLVGYLSRLDELYESVLNLKWELGYSNQEIAMILDISEENVRLRLHRGRKQLISLLQKEGIYYGQ